jgi:hypothetical protein
MKLNSQSTKYREKKLKKKVSIKKWHKTKQITIKIIMTESKIKTKQKKILKDVIEKKFN